MGKEYMSAFKKARTDMGFKHTSAFVPSNRMADFALYIERLKAERMIEICELPPTSRERETLASRNVTDVPSPTEVTSIMERNALQTTMQKTGKQCIEHLEKANSCMNVGKMASDHEEFVKWTSLAVAHNHMASVLWNELAQMHHQLTVRK